MRFLYTTYLILGLFFLLSSCSYKQNQILFEQKGSIPDSVLAKVNMANISNYHIQPQDILQIRNLQNSKTIIDLTPNTAATATVVPAASNLPETFQVEQDGTVALTGLGHVKVEGLTRLEAMKHIEDLYKETFLKAPIIEVKIINLKVTVLGELKSPGNYPLTRDRTSLVEMIGAAGGLTDKANESDVKIYRGNKDNPTVIQIDLRNLTAINDPRTMLQNDDVIYVAQNKRAVRNDQFQNFATTIQPALVLLSAIAIILSITRR